MKHAWVCWLILSLGCTQATAPTGDQKPTSASSSQGANSAAPALRIGSPAPELKVSRFLKGEPVTAFEPEKIYVVEFWATWCGPCVAAMPHVSELQERHPEVTFIGVNVWEDDEDAAENFLKTHGDKIEYRIARDVIPDAAKARDGIMAQTWLAAAESSGIPEAFVVDGQGRIAQITHPMALDASLPQIIAGTWDIAAAAKTNDLDKAP